MLLTCIFAQAQDLCNNAASFTFAPYQSTCNAITQLTPTNMSGTHLWSVVGFAPAVGNLTFSTANPVFYLPGLPVGGTVEITHTITISGVVTVCTQFMTLSCEAVKCNENLPSQTAVIVSINPNGCTFNFNLNNYFGGGYTVQSIAFGDNITQNNPPATVSHNYGQSLGAVNVVINYTTASGQPQTCTFPIVVACKCDHPNFTYSNSSFDPCSTVCVQFNDLCNGFPGTIHTWNFGDGSPAISGLQTQPIIGDPLNTGTFGDPVHCYSLPAPNPIVVTHGLNGLVSTSTTLIPANYLPSNTFIVGQPNQQTDIDLTTLPLNQSNGAQIVVYGDLLIDHNYTFTNACQFFMQPGSSMSTTFDLANFGTTVTHNLSNINACSAMWRGIVMNSGTNLTMNNCSISDAQYAIRFDNLNVITLNANQFRNNYVGIYTPPTAQNNFFRNSILSLTNNAFTCNNPLLPAFPGQLPALNPAQNNFAYAGMEINNLAFLAFPAASNAVGQNNGNNFNRLGNGLIARNVGVLNIDGTAFYNIGTLGTQSIVSNNVNACINGTGGICNPINGVGLFYDNDPGVIGSLIFSGLLNYLSPPFLETFINVRTGIYTSNVGVNIQTTDMLFNASLGGINAVNNFNNGILIQGFQAGQNAVIHDNRIWHHQRGIELQSCELANSIMIDRNVITGLPIPISGGTNGSLGISVTSTSQPNIATNPVSIILNTAIDRRICYNAVNLGNITMSDNLARCLDGDDLNIPDLTGSFMFGFNITNCNGPNSLISCNEARPSENPTTSTIFQTTGAVTTAQHIAFNFASSPLMIRCNTADRLRTGYRFLGPAIGTTFMTNTVGRHRRGLWLAPNADIGVQGLSAGPNSFNGNGNVWTTPEPNNAQNAPAFLQFTQNTGPLDFLNINRMFNNRFWVNVPNATTPNTNPLCYWPTRVSTAAPTQSGVWPTAPNSIWFLNSQGTPQSCANFAACTLFTPLPFMENETETKIAEGDTVAVIFRPESMWMSQQNLYEKLAESGDIASLDESLWDFYTEASNGIMGSLHTIKSSIRELSLPNLLEYETNVNALTAQLAALEQQVLPETSLEDLQAILLLRKPISDTLQLLIENERAEYNEQLLALQSAMDDIKSNNDDVVTEKTIQENERAINRICLETTLKGTHALTHEQAYEVFGIANQCPFKGGTGVYRARALYELYDANINYDDEALCNAVGIEYLTRPEDETTAEYLSLSPNPADKHIDVRCMLPNAILHIRDIAGREVLSSVIVPDISFAYRWDISGLPEGIYLIQTEAEGHILSSQRFVIAR